MEKWYGNIQGCFDLPLTVSKDNDYLPSLEKELSRYLENLTYKVKIPKIHLDEVSDLVASLLKSVEYYYGGNVTSAQQLVMKILRKYSQNTFVYSELKNSYSFRGISPFLNSLVIENKEQIQRAFSNELSFFKARVSNDPVDRFESEHMLHIPFDDRGKVKTQRFSIAGIPCMYFGSSSYVCWLELGKPQNELFNVCSYQIDDTIRVLNLVSPWSLICGLTSGVDSPSHYSVDKDKLIADLIKLWPLVCATSFRVEERGRSFRSEYIVSQLVMLCLSELNVDAVAYVSKQTRNDTIGYPNCVNLAMPMKHGSSRISNICKKIKLSSVVNFGEYSKLNSADKWCRNKSFINNYYGWNKIELAARNIPYHSSVFGEFDNYLVSLEHQIVDIDKLNGV